MPRQNGFPLQLLSAETNHFSLFFWQIKMNSVIFSFSLIIDHKRGTSLAAASLLKRVFFQRVFPDFRLSSVDFAGFPNAFHGFYRVLLSSTGFLSNMNGFCRVLPGITGSYRVLLGFTRSLLGSVGFAGFSNDVHGFYRVLLGFT